MSDLEPRLGGSPGTSVPGEGALRLQARDGADVEVLSALLQDAIIPGADMLFERNSKRFIFIANRFCWERPALAEVSGENGEPIHERSLCGVRVEGVRQVLQQGMPSKRKMALLNLLAITSAKGENETREITLVFSGQASLRLIVESIDIVAEDIDEARPTTYQPRHDAE